MTCISYRPLHLEEFLNIFVPPATSHQQHKMTTSTPKVAHSIVLDSGPIIKNEPAVSTLLAQAETLYTIPAVIDEIRDAVTRNRIETTLLPFLKLRSPRPASIKFVQDFARKTGDLEVLSRPDLHLMALAYELECEQNHGDWRLRNVPGQKGLNGEPPAELTEAAPTGQNTEAAEAPQPNAPIPESRGAWGTKIPEAESSQEATIEDALADAHIYSAEVPPAVEELEPEPVVEASEEVADQPNGTAEEISEEDSDEEGWITPGNLKKHQEKGANSPGDSKAEPETMQVAIITTDFAMQNVLLRMNINLLTPSLMRIKQLKMWVLRCHACFQITKDMSKQFCGRCGKPTLLRTSCSTQKDGTFKIHLKRNMQWNNRGNVFSVPKPVAGSSNTKRIMGGGKDGWGQSLILAEDQKEYVQAMTGQRRNKERDLMDDDYLPGILSGDRGRAGGRIKVGAGKNVNAKKRK